MNIAILGSTGSIGQNALRVIRHLPGSHRVKGLSALKNITLLKKQIAEHHPKIVCVGEKSASEELKKSLHKKGTIDVVCGTDGLAAVAAHPSVDMVLVSLVGSVGILPLLAAIRAGKKIALANKESLVIAGDLVMREAKKHGVDILPVDSEHSAIFQCIQSSGHAHIKKIILTASGGPFYRRKTSFHTIRVQDALSHPNWRMGKKISIDSATLMNKGLEAIEAHHLFGIPMDRIQILIHPQSIVHSLVEFVDGSVLAQLSNPDMRMPIQYALTFPERFPGAVKRLKLEDIRKLEFSLPDYKRFPCLGLALQAGTTGGTMPVVLNASNEVAVEAFLKGKISFTRIASVVCTMMAAHKTQARPDIGTILSIDRWARVKTGELVS